MRLNNLLLENVLQEKENLLYFKELFLDESFNEFLHELELNDNKNDIFGITYVVKRISDNEKIGFVSLGNKVEKNDFIATSLYYGVDVKHRGQRLGQMILNEVSTYLLDNKLVNLIVVNVDRNNHHSITAIENSNFIYQPEYSDEDDLQYHRK